MTGGKWITEDERREWAAELREASNDLARLGYVAIGQGVLYIVESIETDAAPEPEAVCECGVKCSGTHEADVTWLCDDCGRPVRVV